MIKTYDNSDNGKIKVFFIVNEEGEIASVEVGNMVVPRKSGYQFYVDDYVAHQIDKVDINFSDGKPTLKVREGETIDETQKTEKELEIERLKREVERLKNEEENEDGTN